jgi:hypothetical protein
MKKIIALLVMSLLCVAAFALPRPSQIEDALAAKNYVEARSMVAEVLREKPDSARAHLLNSYLLVHADRNKVAANAELQTAVGLDKRGDVKSSALFGRVVAEIDSVPARPIQAPLPATSAPSGDGFPWVFAILILSVGGIGLYMVLRRRTGLGDAGFSSAPAGSSAPRGATFREAYEGPSTSAPPPTASVHEHYYTQAAQAQPMGAFGTAASVAGGVVAGNMLSDALRHHHHDAHSTYDNTAARRRHESEEEEARRSRDSWSSTYSDPSPVSTSSERSSFSSSSSGSDTWSSSSSYSSSSDSSSSSDWGSSSSSSDW